MKEESIMMKTGRGIVKLGIGLLLFLLAACGSGNEGNAGSIDTASKAEGAVQPREPAELVIYSTSGWSEDMFNGVFGDSIRQKFPQHTIKYIQSQKGSTYPDLIAAGTPIDIVWESVSQFTSGPLQYKMQSDMTAMIKQRNIDLNRFDPSMIEAMRTMSEGKLYALPVLNNTLVLFYNKDLFDKFGVPYPKDGMNWDQVIDLNKKMTRTDGSTQYLGLAFSAGHNFRLNSFSLPYLDPATGKATVNNGKWNPLYQTLFVKPVESSAIYKDYVTDKGAPSTSAFTKDKIAAMYAALANGMSTVTDMQWDLVSYPTFKEAPGIGPQPYPTYFGLSAISKHKEQAMDVIQYLISDEFQVSVSRRGNPPAIRNDATQKTFGVDSDYYRNRNAQALFYNKAAALAPKSFFDGKLESFYLAYVKDLATGKLDLNTMLRTADEKANQYIAENKK
jgi:multiple sugar transport system substrate-binding protein